MGARKEEGRVRPTWPAIAQHAVFDFACRPRSSGFATRSGLWGWAGFGMRGAAAVARGRWPVTCVRVPSPDRPHGLGLVAATLEVDGTVLPQSRVVESGLLLS